MAKQKTRRVVFQPAAYNGLQAGMNQIINVVRPTLGPRPRVIAFEPPVSSRSPELLDNGGVIARRIIELRDRDQDMGAMFVRQLLWALHEQVGDGTATAAVLFQSIYNQGLRYIAAGGNAMLLRKYLGDGVEVIRDELTGMAIHLDGKEALAEIAESICYDPALARTMGEIFDIVGEYGQLEIRSGRSREVEREYVEGMYWKGNILSRQMITDESDLRATMDDAAILITDLLIEDARQLAPVIGLAMKAKVSSLMIIARKLSDGAIALLLANNKPGKFETVAVKTPGSTTTDIAATLEDMAVLTGGRPIVTAAGDYLKGVGLEHLGHARRVWADRFNFGVIGGKGDARALRKHIADLRASYARAEDPQARKGLRQRIGKLMGGSATLWVGGTTGTEIDARKQVAERTAEAMRGAVREGVIPGGGVSLLACRPALREKLDQSRNVDEQAAYRVLIKAMESPIRTIIANAGYDDSETMAEIRQAGPGYGFDARSEQVVDMAQAGIFDAAAVQKAAVRGAVKSAALALTIDVLVHRKQPEQSMNP